jgi:UDP:flavonoid glycosyltransferase YjiC (YdhE family)
MRIDERGRPWILAVNANPDFSPTAGLAANVRRIPAGAIGIGIVCPPRATPMPPLPGRAGRAEARLEVERFILDNINAALSACGAAPLARLAQMLPPMEDMLCTFPEVDHYGARPDGTYLGAIDHSFGTAAPRWPMGGGPRVLCYLGGEYAGLGGVAAGLASLGHPTLIHLRGAEAADRGVTGANIMVSTVPVDLDRALDDADLVICHAGHGLTTRSLLKGRPLVFLPTQGEQEVVAERVAALGAGLVGPSGSASGRDHAAVIERALADPGLSLSASRFAEAYAGFDPSDSIRAIVDSYERLSGERA